jgi:hypothetical protein
MLRSGPCRCSWRSARRWRTGRCCRRGRWGAREISREYARGQGPRGRIGVNRWSDRPEPAISCNRYPAHHLVLANGSALGGTSEPAPHEHRSAVGYQMPDLHRRSSGAFCPSSDVITSYLIDRSTRPTSPALCLQRSVSVRDYRVAPTINRSRMCRSELRREGVRSTESLTHRAWTAIRLRKAERSGLGTSRGPQRCRRMVEEF